MPSAVGKEEEEEEMLLGIWLLLAAVKCCNVPLVQLLVEWHGMQSHMDGHGQSELHMLAKSQRGPFLPYPLPPRFMAHLLTYICA
jgi:hypothetical protein